MPFPVQVGSTTLRDPPALATAALDDARAGGGSLVAGKGVCVWVHDLVKSKGLEREIAISLAAMLLGARHGAAVCEGARLAAILRHPPLDALVGTALTAHDIGVLLEPDPANPGRSTEDALLTAWAEVAPLDDRLVRADLLERLRHAGLADLEVQVLAIWASAQEIRAQLPAVFLEGVPARAPGAIRIGLVRGGAVEAAIRDVVATLAPGVREQLL